MKTFIAVFTFFTLLIFSCTQALELSNEDRAQVENEINQFMSDFIPEKIEPMEPEKMFNYFIKNDELAVATGGVLLTDPAAVLLKIPRLQRTASIKAVAARRRIRFV